MTDQDYVSPTLRDDAKLSAILQKTYDEHALGARPWGVRRKVLIAGGCSYAAGCAIGISLTPATAERIDDLDPESYTIAEILDMDFQVRLERERKREVRGSIFAGIRTFPLIALLGAVRSRLSGEVGAVVIPLGFSDDLPALGESTGPQKLCFWKTSALKLIR